MDILMLTVITIIALSMLLGKPLKISITHKMDTPPATLVEDLNIDKEEMNNNAMNIMTKFNKEWSGLDVEEN